MPCILFHFGTLSATLSLLKAESAVIAGPDVGQKFWSSAGLAVLGFPRGTSFPECA
jgi:hypothetical protein